MCIGWRWTAAAGLSTGVGPSRGRQPRCLKTGLMRGEVRIPTSELLSQLLDGSDHVGVTAFDVPAGAHQRSLRVVSAKAVTQVLFQRPATSAGGWETRVRLSVMSVPTVLEYRRAVQHDLESEPAQAALRSCWY